MKMSIEVEIAPFKVPSCVGSVIPGNPFDEVSEFKHGRTYRLEELSAETLDALCAEFRVNVFKAAKKEDAIGITKGFNTTGEKWETRI